MASTGEETEIRYAQILAERLPAKMLEPVPGRALWAPVQVVIIAGCTASIVDLRLNILLKFLVSLVIGFSFCSLGILAHEILHGAVVDSRWLRRVLATVCLAPLLIGPALWMIWHNIHHAHTQHPLHDPDTWGTIDGAPADRTMGFLRRFVNSRSLVFLFLLATGVTGHAAALLFVLRRRMSGRQRLVTLAEFSFLLIFWLSLGFWLGWAHFLFFYLVPLLIANLIINSFVVTNHFLNPLCETGDPLATSLTVTAPRWIERLFLNFNYHAEHHLLPGMSPKYAPQIARMLMELWPDRYHQMPHRLALLAVWRTPRVYRDHFHLIDFRRGEVYGTLGHGLDTTRRNPESAPKHP